MDHLDLPIADPAQALVDPSPGEAESPMSVAGADGLRHPPSPAGA